MRKDVTAKCVACPGEGRGRRHQPQKEAARQAEEGQGADALVWQCEHSAGGHCGAEDAGRVRSSSPARKSFDRMARKKNNRGGRDRLAKMPRQGAILQSPFSKLPGVTLSSWRDEPLPEMLWATILTASLERDIYLQLFRDISARCEGLESGCPSSEHLAQGGARISGALALSGG